MFSVDTGYIGGECGVSVLDILLIVGVRCGCRREVWSSVLDIVAGVGYGCPYYTVCGAQLSVFDTVVGVKHGYRC